VSEMLLPGVVLLYFSALVEIRIAKCFTESGKRFQCKAAHVLEVTLGLVVSVLAVGPKVRGFKSSWGF
jgi:hypothetical protein